MANRPKQSPKRTLPIIPGAPMTSVRVGPYQVIVYKRTLPAVPGTPVIVAPGVIAIPPYVDPYGGFVCPSCPVTESAAPRPGTISFVTESLSVHEHTPGYARVYVQRLGGSDGASSVYYTTADGTATSPTYYTAVSGTLSWLSNNAATQSFDVTIIDNAQWVLYNRKFSASLSSPVNSALGLNKAIVTILNDDPFTPGSVTFQYNTGTVEETAGSLSIYVFRVSGSDGIASVDYTTIDGTAVNPTNYLTTTGSFTWAHADASPKTISVPIVNSMTIGGPSLYFTASLSNFGGVGQGTYPNDFITITLVSTGSAGTVQFSSASYSVAENTPGYVILSATRTGGVSGSATINYTSSNGTAVTPTNYTGSYGTLSWANNDGLPKSFSVGITNDGIWTPDLKFTSSLYNATGSTLGTISQSIVTILNSTPYTPGTMSFVSSSYSVNEDTISLTLHVQRTSGSNGTASVNYTASNGTAINPTNYTGSYGTLTWADGNSTIQSFDILIKNIAGWNPDLIFTASLNTPVNAALGLSRSIVTIMNVDPYNPGYILNDQDEIFTYEAPNAEQVSTSFSRYSGSDGPASVYWGTVDGTAIQGTNYFSTTGTVSWAHGESGSKWVLIDLMNDGVWRESLNPVYFYVNQLAEPVGALPGYRISTYIFLENVNPPQRGTMSFVSPTYSVAENSPGYVRLYVTRSGGSDGTASVSYVALNGTAVFPTDFTFTNGTLNWANGEHMTKSFDVPIIDNAQWVAVNKAFTGSLTTVVGGIKGTVSQSIVTIINDDLPVPGTLSFTNESLFVDEDDGTITVYVIRQAGSDGAISTDYSTINGTAVSPTNYTSTGGTLNWASGDVTAKSFVVPIINDGVYSNPNLYFTAQLENPVNTSYELDVTTIEIQDVSFGTIQFVSSSYVAYESSSLMTFHITRSGGTAGIASADFTTIDGTAISGSDYTGSAETLTWASGNGDLKTINIVLEGEDGVIDGDKIFTGSLSNVIGATLGLSQSTVTIVDTTAIIQFTDALYVGEDSATVQTLWYERLGYAGNDISMSVSGSEGLNTLTPSGQVTKGITAEPGIWGGTTVISWASGSNALASHTISMNRTDQGSSNCTRSIEAVSPLATMGSPSVADTLQLIDGGFPPINVTSFGWVGNLKPQSLDVVTYTYNSFITTSIRNFSGGGQFPTTVSFVTMDGTAKSGSDYAYTNGTSSFLTSGAAGIDIFEGPSVEGYPSMAGKYFYIKLTSVEPEKTASIMYPSKLKINGSSYGGSYVTMLTSSIVQPGTNAGGKSPFDVYVSRSGDITDPLTVKVNIGGATANIDPYESYGSLDPDYSIDVSWNASEGGQKTVLDLPNFATNTFQGAVLSPLTTNGYLSMSLAKSSPSDNVVFMPSASVDITFQYP